MFDERAGDEVNKIGELGCGPSTRAEFLVAKRGGPDTDLKQQRRGSIEQDAHY